MHIAIKQIIQHDVLYATYINPHHLSNKQARTIWLVLFNDSQIPPKQSDWTIDLKRSPTISSWKEQQTENLEGHVILQPCSSMNCCKEVCAHPRIEPPDVPIFCNKWIANDTPGRNRRHKTLCKQLMIIPNLSKSLCTKACGNIAAVLDWLAATGKNLTDWGKSLLTRSAAFEIAHELLQTIQTRRGQEFKLSMLNCSKVWICMLWRHSFHRAKLRYTYEGTRGDISCTGAAHCKTESART